ncbi:MBL fold metallo-hydrolase [Pseudomonas sp. RIT-PI-S]|uniref:MBL fold metallo-hydrolase n=1 Tax=Pseudomonas sp. RIT-PI-S TaxID=3035295 RepID=UPI0021D935F4|nr:MBL fold metallo-hydrolase [Pseudomonas sp. RIT-PI-S]
MSLFSLQRYRPLGLLALAVASLAQAQPVAQVKTQVPGYFRLAVGDYEVTALFDGYNDLSPDLLQGLSKDAIRALLTRQHVDPARMRTHFNTFLVNTGSHLILVDTGAGQCIGETAGSLVGNLRAAGYEPEQVDTILLTHLHLDHVCGLVDGQGAALFNQAKVYVEQAEADYWLSSANMAKAPAAARELFEIAQRSVAPYKAAGRLQTFVPPAAPVPEVQTQLEAGHTPGSTTYRFTSAGHSIVFIGDLVHSLAVQFEHPEVGIHFDSNSPQAIATRRAVFGGLADGDAWVGAAHLPFPGLGHISRHGKVFEWVPALYGPYQPAAQVPLLK